VIARQLVASLAVRLHVESTSKVVDKFSVPASEKERDYICGNNASVEEV
jgi:hypothetical protein